MKAVVLAGGLGTRMRRQDKAVTLTAEQRAAADAGVKAMMPVGRPFLDYVLSALADAGVREVCLVVAPDAEAVRRHFMVEARPRRLVIEFAVQREPRGTADALLAAEASVGRGAFLVLNADNYYPVPAYRALAEQGGPGVIGFDRDALVRGGNVDPGRIRRYALLHTDAAGYLVDLVEKPDDATFAAMGEHALVSMNLWAFTPAIFDACRAVKPSARGELELPEAVRLAIRELGVRVKVIPMMAPVLDLANRGDVPAVAALLRDVTVDL